MTFVVCNTTPVHVDMCRFGLRLPKSPHLIRKSTEIQSTCPAVIHNLQGFRCSQDHSHLPIQGSCKINGKTIRVSTFTASYTRKFARFLAQSMLECVEGAFPAAAEGDLVPGLTRKRFKAPDGSRRAPDLPPARRFKRSAPDASSLPQPARKSRIDDTPPQMLDSLDQIQWQQAVQRVHEQGIRVGTCNVERSKEAFKSLQVCCPACLSKGCLSAGQSSSCKCRSELHLRQPLSLARQWSQFLLARLLGSLQKLFLVLMLNPARSQLLHFRIGSLEWSKPDRDTNFCPTPAGLTWLADQQSWALLGRRQTSGHSAQIGHLLQIRAILAGPRKDVQMRPLQEPAARPRRRNHLTSPHLNLGALSCELRLLCWAPPVRHGATVSAPSLGGSVASSAASRTSSSLLADLAGNLAGRVRSTSIPTRSL